MDPELNSVLELNRQQTSGVYKVGHGSSVVVADKQSGEYRQNNRDHNCYEHADGTSLIFPDAQDAVTYGIHRRIQTFASSRCYHRI